ncbi:pancreatic lipase-related protein 2-like isoform X2 [Phymastichus coffea]|nr:pancreatic lipase-related protein 2-like isoform X2 [Phymastichus coffea]
MMDNLIDATTGTEGPLTALTVTDKGIGFYLFTRENPNEPVILDVDDIGSLRSANFNRSAPTKVLVHGWMDSGSSWWMHDFRRNYLNSGYYNVIIVDWSSGSSKEYLIAARFVKRVGYLASRLLEYLIMEGIANPDNIHILGHSLGAHVAGLVGSNLAGRLARITGMDPARPDFEAPLVRDPRERLDPSDAKFVDVIHTCAGTAGFVRPLGHADFYPNGGSFRQPGCPVLIAQSCSHGRSHQFMSESIVNPLAFPAVECSGWRKYKMDRCDKTKNRVAFMGENLRSSVRGVYFLETNAASPFGKKTL